MMQRGIQSWVAVIMAAVCGALLASGMTDLLTHSSNGSTTTTTVAVMTNAQREDDALNQCIRASQSEQNGAPGSPAIYGQCVEDVTGAFHNERR